MFGPGTKFLAGGSNMGSLTNIHFYEKLYLWVKSHVYYKYKNELHPIDTEIPQ